ncbi:DUF5060 domain-containing protein [Breznakiella homolactica]|uniref:Uncharacterized protein n=1 Tax=Breznakiella homolactica TaxID=2798577 RepID=A0A7T7XQ37_9SPIR|nr:DUF5060 domain-containing protein [Breznakiella homolactica]QQO10312.1 DUF5060 domain-containing protein [Breznakiella homolactica]
MAGMYPDEQTIEIFGEEITWPGLDTETGKFTNGSFTDPSKKPSFIPAETMNLVLDNISSLITEMGGTPNTESIDQLIKLVKDPVYKGTARSDGFQLKPKIIDLSAATYNRDTYYPVVSTSKIGGSDDNDSAKSLFRLSVNIDWLRTQVPWSTHPAKHPSAIMEMLINSSGWGISKAESICLTRSMHYVSGSTNPIGYSQMTNASRAVVWLRGGAVYEIRNDWGSSWDIKTVPYTEQGITVQPQTKQVFDFIRAAIGAKIEDQKAAIYNWNELSSGIVIETDIPGTAQGMINLFITGNGYSTKVPIDTKIQVYNYQSGPQWLNPAQINLGAQLRAIQIYVHTDGYVRFYLPKRGNFETYFLECLTAGEPSTMGQAPNGIRQNRITAVSTVTATPSMASRAFTIPIVNSWQPGTIGNPFILETNGTDLHDLSLAPGHYRCSMNGVAQTFVNAFPGIKAGKLIVEINFTNGSGRILTWKNYDGSGEWKCYLIAPSLGEWTGWINQKEAESVKGATNANTANTIIKRDASGRAKVTAPAAADDIATLASVRNYLPVGTIIMYDANKTGVGASGTWTDNVTIPGWYACIPENAAKGCPNMVDRFPMGKVLANAGAAGGSASITLSAAQMPVHNHSINHTHSASSGNQSANHSHSITINKTTLTGKQFLMRGVSGDIMKDNGNLATPTGSGGFTMNGADLDASHIHTGSSGTESASHNHAITITQHTGNSGNTGSGAAISIRNPYYSVIFIRKCS